MRSLPRVHMRTRAATCALAAMLLSACHHIAPPPDTPPETRVAYRVKIAPGAPHYEEKEDETSNSPVPVENPAPMYPPSAIALHLPHVAVTAKVIIDRDGNVGDVRVAPSAEEPRPVEFDEAVRAAVRRWRFTPLTFTRWQEVKDAEGNVVDSRIVAKEQRPFSLDFDFFFELREGMPFVGALPASGKHDRHWRAVGRLDRKVAPPTAPAPSDTDHP